jgi:molybdopterin-guanine dinucleotide biosynthesis protein A
MVAERPVVGVILAGGLGKRIGGEKALVELEGRPLLHYPLELLRSVTGEVAVVAKADTQLPALDGVPVWTEPEEPRHPLTGIVHALRCAGGRPVLAVACDMPLLTEELLHMLLVVREETDTAVVPQSPNGLEAHVALYTPLALEGLAGFGADRPMREVVADLAPHILEWPDAEPFLNVNAPEDLLAAASALHRRRHA